MEGGSPSIIIQPSRNANVEFVDAVIEWLLPTTEGGRRSRAVVARAVVARATAVVVTAIATLAVSKISDAPAVAVAWILRTHAKLWRTLRYVLRFLVKKTRVAARCAAMLEDDVCVTIPEFYSDDIFNAKPNIVYADLMWFFDAHAASALAADAADMVMLQVDAAADVEVHTRSADRFVPMRFEFPHPEGGAPVRAAAAKVNDAGSGRSGRQAHVVVLSTRPSGVATSAERVRSFVANAHRLRAEAKRGTVWKPAVHNYVGGAWREREVPNRKRFEHVALSAAVKTALVADLDAFMAGDATYAAKGMRWNRGYLLHGPPGCGKSSCIAAMSSHYRLPVYVVNLREVSGDDALRAMFGALPERVMVVLEDVDCMTDAVLARKHEPLDAGAEVGVAALVANALVGQQQRVTLSGLLNVLDGLETGNGRVLVMTTNHRRALDPALVRPGRCDVHVELGFCTMEHVDFLFNLYVGVPLEGAPQATRNAIAEVLQHRDVTPADVTGILMPMAIASAAPPSSILASTTTKDVGTSAATFARQLTDMCCNTSGSCSGSNGDDLNVGGSDCSSTTAPGTPTCAGQP